MKLQSSAKDDFLPNCAPLFVCHLLYNNISLSNFLLLYPRVKVLVVANTSSFRVSNLGQLFDIYLPCRI